MVSGSPPGDDETEDKSSVAGVAGDVAKHGRAIAILAMENAPPGARILVFVLYAIFGISLIGLLVPPYEAYKQIFVIILAVASFIYLWRMMIRQSKRLDLGARLRNPEKVDDIQRGSDVIGLSLEDYDRAVSLLTQIRENVFRCLAQKQSGVSIHKIRANVFLPKESHSGSSYVLNIYPGLHVNMNNVQEREIAFGPGEGLTGRVFEEGMPRVAERIPGEATGWDSTYKLTPDQVSRIHPKLQWICSLPLKDGKTTIGVVNIDGLQDIVHVDDLYGCVRGVYYELNAMQALLSQARTRKELRS